MRQGEKQYVIAVLSQRIPGVHGNDYISHVGSAEAPDEHIAARNFVRQSMTPADLARVQEIRVTDFKEMGVAIPPKLEALLERSVWT
jgi:hypothetical protein